MADMNITEADEDEDRDYLFRYTARGDGDVHLDVGDMWNSFVRKYGEEVGVALAILTLRNHAESLAESVLGTDAGAIADELVNQASRRNDTENEDNQ